MGKTCDLELCCWLANIIGERCALFTVVLEIAQHRLHARQPRRVLAHLFVSDCILCDHVSCPVLVHLHCTPVSTLYFDLSTAVREE
jgi:hypothetical protein